MHEGYYSTLLGMKGIPAVSEETLVARDVMLAKLTGAHVHIAHLSTAATLLPGTLISTGSPGGAGYSRDPQIFLRDRSTVTVGIDGIGELTTHCRILG